jgi:hypothetical protein
MVLGVFNKKLVDPFLLSIQLLFAFLSFGVLLGWKADFRQLVGVKGELFLIEEFFFIW